MTAQEELKQKCEDGIKAVKLESKGLVGEYEGRYKQGIPLSVFDQTRADLVHLQLQLQQEQFAMEEILRQLVRPQTPHALRQMAATVFKIEHNRMQRKINADFEQQMLNKNRPGSCSIL